MNDFALPKPAPRNWKRFAGVMALLFALGAIAAVVASDVAFADTGHDKLSPTYDGNGGYGGYGKMGSFEGY